MFGSQEGSCTTTAPTTSSSIIGSGYEAGGLVKQFGALRTKFQNALTISDSDATVAVIEANAKLEGQYRGFNSLLKRASKQKLAAARAISNTYNSYWQHAQSAAQLELGWRQSTARNLEQMSEKLIDLGTVEASHNGYAQYSNVADKLISY